MRLSQSAPRDGSLPAMPDCGALSRACRVAGMACAALFALAGCVHAGDGPATVSVEAPTRSPQGPANALDAGPGAMFTGATASPDRDAGRAPLITVRDAAAAEGRCPVPVEHPELEVARIGRVRITACDLALEWHRRTRAGLRADDPRALVDALVDDALRATRAPMPPPTDAEIAQVLADALVHREALARMHSVDTSDAALARHAEEHAEDFVREARVRVRALVLRTREAAAEAIAALRGGTAFVSLLPRSVDPDATRDGGDLGLLPLGGVGGVPRAVVAAAFALGADGEVAAEPIAATVRLPSADRRRHRARTAEVFYVVQRTERTETAALPEAVIRRRVAQRLLRDRYRHARREAESELRAAVATRAREAVVPAALDAVRLEPAGPR